MKFFYQILLFSLSFLVLNSCSEVSDEELIKQSEELLDEHDWEGVIKVINKFIERHPNDRNAYFTRALANSNLKERVNLDLVITDLDKVIELDSNNTQALIFRFEAHFAANYFEKALKDIDKLIAIKGESPYLLSWKGNCAFAAKNFKLAETMYLKRLESNGEYEDLKNNYYYMVLSKYFGGNKEGAAWDVAFMEKRGMKRDPDFEKAIINQELKWKDIPPFQIPERSIEDTEKLLNAK